MLFIKIYTLRFNIDLKIRNNNFIFMQLKNEGPDTSTGKLYHGLPSNHIYNGKCCQTATNHHVQQMLFNLISTLSN